MTRSDMSSANLLILMEKNWSRWSTQMWVLFKYQDVLEVVEDDHQEFPAGVADDQKAEERKKDNKALFIIHQCVDDAHFEKIQHVETTREAWSILIRCHTEGEKIKKVKLQTLRRQYELMKMMQGDRVREYFDKVIAITNQMKGCREVITNLMVIEKIMRSLSQKFDYIVMAIEESKELNKMKIEELQSSLEAHEMRLFERNPIRIDEHALKVHHSKNEEKKTFKKWKGKHGKGKWRNDRTKDDQDESSTEEEGKPDKNFHKKDKRNVECFNCHKYGHYSYECHAEQEEQKKAQGKEAYIA
ncbi:uncharacterized protein LOC108330506 [Vigna angularis]|uniref:uncharacterized protein LOC108330506 n=1 Tax=Phaseolus angularis TaxID=3914 RepID=UPI000809B3AD|nr:uncharacterized protein LOC108330506 [Vigna angularis]